MQSLTKSLSKAFFSNWLRLSLSALSVAAFLTAWWLLSAYLRADWPFQGVTPSPDATAERFPYWWDVLRALGRSFVTRSGNPGNLLMSEHIYASLKRISIAFALAFISAVPLGLLMGRSRNSEAVGRPLVELFRPIPPLAWVPIFLAVFKFFWGPIAIVFLGIFFPILLNVRLGARSVDPVLIDAARTLGARRSTIFGKVVLPFTTPYLMTGITVGLGIGWMCIVAAEMLGAVGGGVGYFIFEANNRTLYDLMYAAMVMIGILSVLTTGIAGLIERWLYRWMGIK
jgi:NitT/TauT family transport system permease protein